MLSTDWPLPVLLYCLSVYSFRCPISSLSLSLSLSEPLRPHAWHHQPCVPAASCPLHPSEAETLIRYVVSHTMQVAKVLHERACKIKGLDPYKNCSIFYPDDGNNQNGGEWLSLPVSALHLVNAIKRYCCGSDRATCHDVLMIFQRQCFYYGIA